MNVPVQPATFTRDGWPQCTTWAMWRQAGRESTVAGGRPPPPGGAWVATVRIGTMGLTEELRHDRLAVDAEGVDGQDGHVLRRETGAGIGHHDDDGELRVKVGA